MIHATDARITIAIPFYSNLEFLGRALQSVVTQDSDRWVCIVSDDCGPDHLGAKQLVDRFADRRITFRQNQANLGLAGNWNACLNAADTDLVTLLHADDELTTGYIRRMLEISACSPQSSLLFCDAQIIDHRSKPATSLVDILKILFRPSQKQLALLMGEPAMAALLRGNFIMCPTVCYRKSLIGAEVSPPFSPVDFAL